LMKCRMLDISRTLLNTRERARSPQPPADIDVAGDDLACALDWKESSATLSTSCFRTSPALSVTGHWDRRGMASSLALLYVR
jgi:hypothetical protein